MRVSRPRGIKINTDLHDAKHTGLLIVDPCNDFMSEGGKLYKAIKPTADESGMFENLRKIIPAARTAKIQVFIVPHHRSHAPDAEVPYRPAAQALTSLLSRGFQVSSTQPEPPRPGPSP